MSLTLTLRVSLLTYFLGLVGFYFGKGSDEFIWFAIGGGLAMVNVGFASWVVSLGLNTPTKKGSFLGFLLFKSFTFLALIAVILMVLKPLLLPFTLGLGIVIFGAIGAALIEARRQFGRKNEETVTTVG